MSNFIVKDLRVGVAAVAGEWKQKNGIMIGLKLATSLF
jgi:hypothetical protein